MPQTALLWDLLVKDNASAALTRISAEADKTATALARTQTRTEAASAKMAAVGSRLTKSLTLPLAAAAAVSVTEAAKYQKGLNTVAVATDKTAKQTAAASKGLMSIAKSTGTSLDQLTASFYDASKAGQPVSKALDTVKAAAQGAKAEGADLGTVTSALTSIMASYGKSIGSPVQAMNAIVRGSGLAKTTIQDFSASLSNVVPLASSLHISFAQVAGAIDTMTQHGETAQRATDNLSNLITNLAGQNNVASSSLQQLGVDTIKLSKNLGRRGLTGSLNDVLAAVAKHSKDGLVVTSAFKQAATATASLKTEISAMPKALQDQSRAFDSGKLGYKDYLDYAKSLGGQNYALARGFLSTESTARGFNKQLTAGNSTVRTTAATLQKALGGVTGMRVALMLSGESAKTFARSTREVAKASLTAGSDVLGWNKTQNTLSTRMDKAKESLQVLAVEIGTALIPAITKIVSGITSVVDWFDNLGSGTKKAIGYFAAFALAIGPVMYIGGKLISVYRGIASVFSLVSTAASRTAAAVTGNSAAITAANTEVSGSEARAAAVWAESEARKAAAAADAAVEIAASVEGTGSILAAQATEAATTAIEFAASEQEKANAAIKAAATITAAESGLAGEMTTAGAAQVAAAQETAAGVIAASREQAAAVESSASRIGLASKAAMGGLLAAGAGYLGASLVGGQANKHIGGGKGNPGVLGGLGILGANVAGGAAGGALLGASGFGVGALPGAVIGGVVGAAKGVIEVWHRTRDAAKEASVTTVKGVDAQVVAVNGLAEALASVGNAYNKQFKANLAQRLGESGALGIASQAGVSGNAVLNAVIGKSATAYNAVSQALEHAQQTGKITTAQYVKVSQAIDQLSVGAQHSEKQLQLENAAMGGGILKSSQLGISLKKLGAATHDTGTSLAFQSAAGERNRAVITENIGTLNRAAAAQIAHGRGVKAVTSDYESQITTMSQNLHQLGFNNAQVNALIGTYARVPKSVATEMKAQGLGVMNPAIQAIINKLGQVPTSKVTTLRVSDEASVKLRGIQYLLNGIHNKTVTVTTAHTDSGGVTHTGTARYGYAAGGSVKDGFFTVGERGYELGYKRGSQVQIYSNAQSKAMTGMDRVPGFASGTAQDNKRAIAALLASMGATKAGIAGFLGNTQVESGFKTTAYNPGENAHGFQQWEGSRLTLLQSIADKMGKSITSQAVQLRMIKHELTHGYGDTLNVLRHATSARSAAAYVDAHYERSSGDARSERMNDAARIFASGVISNVNKIVHKAYPGRGDGAPGSGRGPVSAPPSTRLPGDHFKLVVPAATAFAKAAARTVTGLVARSVRPADTSVAGLAGQVRYQGLRATNLTQASMKARNVYAQEATHVAKLTAELTNLRLAQRKDVDALRAHATALGNEATKASQTAAAMPAKTKADKAAKAAAESNARALRNQATAASQNATAVSRANAQQVAALEKLQQAASKAASKAKDAWSGAASAAKNAQQAAESAAKALVDSLQSQADALVSAVQGFQSTISQGLTQGTDLAALWGQVTSAQSDATDQLATANQNLADAQQAVADAQDAITKAQPDTSSLLAAQNAAAQAQAQFTQAHSTLLAAQAAVAAGAGTPAQYAALTAAQQRQSDTLTALAAANSDLASAQQAVSQATGPTQDDLNALTTAQANLAAATTAAATAASNAASNTGSYANLQAAFDATLKSTQNFAADLSKLTAEGAGQDLVSQIAAMGAASGDALAQQLLAAGPDGIKALQASMTAIQNVAGKEADVLSKGFYSAGANSLMQLVAGMEKQFPALKAALAPIVAQLQAMFTFTPTVVAAGGSSATSSTGSSTRVITTAYNNTLGQIAANYGVKLDDIDALNSKYTKATAATKVAAGTKLTIPGFAAGVSNFGGGLAYVHADELVSVPRGSNVHTKTETKNIFDTSRLEREQAETNSHLASLAQRIADASDERSMRGYDQAGRKVAGYNKRAIRRAGQFSR